MMANAGLDVWLVSMRGSRYNRKHKTKNPDKPEEGFWDFSWQEMGIYDLPAVLEFLSTKVKGKINLLGYS